MATPIGLDPANYVNTVVGNFVLGAIYQDEASGMLYQYLVNHPTDGALAAGNPCVLTVAASNAGVSWVVTKNGGASQLGAQMVVALVVRAVPVANFFFGMVSGQYPFAINAANSVTAGTPVTASGGAAGNWINTAAATTAVFGYAEANASGGVFPMKVRCL